MNASIQNGCHRHARGGSQSVEGQGHIHQPVQITGADRTSLADLNRKKGNEALRPNHMPMKPLGCFLRVAQALCLCLTMILIIQGLHAKERPPNILFILTEDQGTHMSFLGTPGLSMTHMGRIAKSDVYCDRAFVDYPVCSPSKASIYTGTYCVTNGLRGVTTNWFDLEKTMPKAIASRS